MYENYSTYGAICPYCRHINKGDNSCCELYDESIEEYRCYSCGKVFLCSAYVEWYWTTRKT